MTQYTEAELVLPSLYMISLAGGFLKTADLIKALTSQLKPTGHDSDIITDRNDTYFSQKVRNLVSHRKLDTLGFADYIPSRQGLQITAKGISHMHANSLAISYLMENNFEWEDVSSALIEIARPDVKIEFFEEVYEGAFETRQTKVYKRSKKLRDVAISLFRDKTGHRLVCEVCSFDYEATYGDPGKGFIEIHHRKPIYMYEGDDEIKTIEKAVKNLAPLCANCHRIIHRKLPPYSIEKVTEFYKSMQSTK